MTDQTTAAPRDGVERIWRGLRDEQDTLLGPAAGQDQTNTAAYRLPVASNDDNKTCLPAPPPEMVHAARAYLTPRHAIGVDAFLWETMEHPLPDLDAIDAVIAASDRAQQGTGNQPQPTELAAALVVLGAARLNLDQTEARLLNAAQASAMGSEQIAAILHLSVEEAEERHRQLKPRLDQPVAEARPVRPNSRPTHRPRATPPYR